MYSILHKIVIETSPEKLIEALTTEQDLSSWWTNAERKGDECAFFFGQHAEHKVVMKTLTSDLDNEVRWQCIEGPWIEKGEFVFSVTEDDRGACLDFAHHGWPETDDFYKHCNSKWGFFLAVSLKGYLETGNGSPHPNDPSI